MAEKNAKRRNEMKRFVATILGTLMIGLMALAMPSVAATDPRGSFDNGNSVSFSSGPLTGVFEGNVPHLKFYATNELGRAVYMVNFRALIEYTPSSSGSGVFQSPEAQARADFDSAAWTHSTNFYSIKDTTGATVGMGFNFTLANRMQIVSMSGQPSGSLGPNDVTLVVKAYNSTKTITVNGQSITIANAEIKIDFVLKNWPFISQNDKLALQVNMHSDFNHFDLDETTGTHGVDATNDEGANVAEHEFHQTSGPRQEVRFSSGLITSSMNIGFFRFVNTATVTPPSGSPYPVSVTAAYKGEKEGNEMFFKLYLSYPSFTGTLVHDPSFGLGPGFPTLFLIVGGAAVAGLVAVVAIRRRHLQVQKDSGRK